MSWDEPRAPMPKTAQRGDRITWTEDDGETRTGVVMDRACIGQFVPAWGGGERFEELPGVHLWVIPDDGRSDTQGCVAIRTALSGRMLGRFERVTPLAETLLAAAGAR